MENLNTVKNLNSFKILLHIYKGLNCLSSLTILFKKGITFTMYWFDLNVKSKNQLTDIQNTDSLA